MSKIIKNTTLTPIELMTTGVTIGANSSFTIEPSEYPRWAIDDFINEVSPLITSGDIVINDGISDLSIVDGINFLKYPDTFSSIRLDTGISPTLSGIGTGSFNLKDIGEYIYENAPGTGEVKVSSNDTTRDYLINKIQAGTNITIQEINDGLSESIRISSTGTSGAVLPSESFMFDNTSSGNLSGDRWLNYGRATSDITSAVIAFDSEVKSITFSNRNNNVDLNIEIYINGSLQFTWSITNKRTAYKTNGLSGISLSQGDIMAIKITDEGTNSRTPVVKVNTQAVNLNQSEGGS